MKNGELRNFLWSSAIIEMQGKRCLINILVDISNLKKIENQLAETNRALQEQSSKLLEMNSALKVLLNQREEERKELETRVWHNIKRMIQPHLNNLRMTNLTTTQQAHLDVVFDRLDDIASGIGERLGYGVYSLSGREMEVAGHIIAGRSNKDIAEILNISVHSIESHRFAIRKKLGILGNRTNLRNHLLSLSKYAEDKNSFLTKEF
ncbi:MAG: response regulator transcription factor [Desulfamplus sp.]